MNAIASTVLERPAPPSVDHARIPYPEWLESLPGGVHCFLNDPQAGYPLIYKSDRFLEILGQTDEELQTGFRNRLSGIVHPDDIQNRQREPCNSPCNAPSSSNDRVFRVKSRNGWRWVAGSFKATSHAGRSVIIGVLVDIDDATSSQLRQQEALEEALNQADRAAYANTVFLRRMSHDMRTPLTGILGLLELCRRNPDDQAVLRESHKKMGTGARHLLCLIEDALQATRLGESELQLACDPVDLTRLRTDIADIIGFLADDAGVTMERLEMAGNIPCRCVLGSELHLRQIFLNIYGNCVKYNRRGGKIVTTVCCIEEASDKVRLRWVISDTGMGMSKEFLGRIFEPFAQEESAAEGSGLGMPIVKHLVELMGGSIEVSSELGVGSTFVIEIPFKLAPAAKEGTGEAVGPGISGRRFLVAEDNELNAEIAVALLEGAGASVAIAADGREAVQSFAESPAGYYDAIFMDVKMPVMDGLAAARAIRALDRPDAESVPIVAVTADTFPEIVRECRNAGMDAHLTKPIDIAKAGRVVTAVLRRKQAQVAPGDISQKS